MSLLDHYKKSSLLWQTATKILQLGPIPRHVAFIMDGNRRFAKNNSIPRSEGHSRGFDKLSECLSWCLELGVKEISVYAFSIENFRRSKDEIDCIMELATDKIDSILGNKHILSKYEVGVRMFGDFELLSSNLRSKIAKVILETEKNSQSFLNICFAYTSRDEMTAATRDIALGIRKGLIREEDITEELFENIFYSAPAGSVDLIIRTSGEVRLSDFMLWQAGFAQLSYETELWPEFSRSSFYWSIFSYQINHNTLQALRANYYRQVEKKQLQKDRENALVEYFKNYEGTSRSADVTDNISLDEAEICKLIFEYSRKRTERSAIFNESVWTNRRILLLQYAEEGQTEIEKNKNET